MPCGLDQNCWVGKYAVVGRRAATGHPLSFVIVLPQRHVSGFKRTTDKKFSASETRQAASAHEAVTQTTGKTMS